MVPIEQPTSIVFISNTENIEPGMIGSVPAEITTADLNDSTSAKELIEFFTTTTLAD